MNEESEFAAYHVNERQASMSPRVKDVVEGLLSADMTSFVVLQSNDGLSEYREEVVSGMNVVLILAKVADNPPGRYWLEGRARRVA